MEQKTVVKVEGTIPYSVSDALCVAKIDESKKLNSEKLFTVNRNLFEEIVEDNKKVEKMIENIKTKSQELDEMRERFARLQEEARLDRERAKQETLIIEKQKNENH